MGCVPTHATPTCCAGWGCRSPSNLSAGRKVGWLTILPFLAQGPSMLSVPDPHKHFFKDIGEEMARRRQKSTFYPIGKAILGAAPVGIFLGACSLLKVKAMTTEDGALVINTPDTVDVYTVAR